MGGASESRSDQEAEGGVEDGGLYDSKMREAVKKKLKQEEKTWEEELDEGENKVAIKTYVS